MFFLLALLVSWHVAAASCNAQASPVRIELVQELVLDGKKEDFDIIMDGGRVNSRGDVALGMRRDRQVRVYDSTGKRVVTFGRRGAGTGEFESPQVQGWRNDTIWVYDSALRRHSLFTRTGVFLRSVSGAATERQVRVAGAPSGASLSWLFPQAGGAEGSTVVTGTLTRSAGKKLSNRTRILASVSKEGVATVMAEVDDDPRWDFELAHTVLWGVAQDATEAVIVTVSDLAPTGSSVLIKRVDSKGSLINSGSIPYRGVPYPKARLDSMLKRGLGIDRNVKSIPASRVPAVLPPVFSVQIRDDGMAFLSIQQTTGRDVAIVDRKGVVRGRFALPDRARVTMVRGDKVWMRIHDNDDLPSIVRFRMRCNPSQCP